MGILTKSLDIMGIQGRKKRNPNKEQRSLKTETKMKKNNPQRPN
jgi:hypothetical protein